MSANDDEIRNQLSVIELRRAVARLSEEVTALLEGKPLADGRYVHHVLCPADRRQPAGTPNIGCTCKVVSRHALEKEDRMRAGVLFVKHTGETRGAKS